MTLGNKIRTAVLTALVLLLAGTAPHPAAAAEDSLSVTTLLPQGRVERITQVVVRFSRPMRPLGALAQEPEEAPLRLDPRPAGSYRWLDPQTLAYILDPPLVGATRLRLTVPAGAKALDGSRLAQSVKAQVETAPVAVTKVAPKAGSVLPPNPRLSLYLNQAVDIESLTRGVRLIVNGRGVPVRVSQPEMPAWQRRQLGLGRVYAVRPERPLPQGAKLELVVEEGLRPSQGNLPSSKRWSIAYKSFGTLGLARHRISTNAQGKADPSDSLLLQFNNPVRPKDLARYLEINPRPRHGPDLKSKHPTRWFYVGGLAPRTTYQVRVKAGLTDDYGTRLAVPISVSFTTGDLPPQFYLPSDKGVLEAGLAAIFPLKLRNVSRARAGLRFIPPQEAARALAMEESRPYNQRPSTPQPGAEWTQVRDLNFSLPPNQSLYRPLDLAKLLGRSPLGGLVLLDLRTTWPDRKGKPKEHMQRVVLQVTDLGLSLKVGRDSGLAWVTRLSTGEPLANVPLELRDRENRLLWNGQSDEDGLARLPSLAELNPAPDKTHSWKNPTLYLLAQHEGQLAVLPSLWQEDLLYSMGPRVPYQRPDQKPQLMVHALTQLPLYQPGQTVRYVLYLRQPDAQGLIPLVEPVELEIKDPTGRQMARGKGDPTEYGTLSGELSLPQGCRLGQYDFTVTWRKTNFHASGFRVASFRPPDFQVKLTGPGNRPASDPKAQADLKADYLFGAPVAQAQVSLQVDQQPTWFAPARLEEMAVGASPPLGQRASLIRHLATLKAQLTAQGTARLDLPQVETLPGQPVQVSLEAKVSDASSRAVTDTDSFIAHPAGIYLGLAAPVLVSSGAPAKVSLAAATWDNQAAPPTPVTLTAYRETWETVRERGPEGFYRFQGRVRRDQVWQGKASVGPGPAGLDFTPKEAGTYVLVAQGKDPQGREARSELYLYASGGGLAGWERFDDHRLELVVQPEKAKPGQSVRLMLKSPFAQATALVSLEREGVRRVLVRQVKGPAPVIEVPVEAGDAPNLYLSVLLVRGRINRPTGRGPDLGRPQVRIGTVQIQVDDPALRLKVDVKPHQKKFRPGQEVRVAVTVAGQDGEPAVSEVTLLAVDQRVLNAAGGKDSYDPWKTFGQERPLAVLTADNRTQVVGQRHFGPKGEEAAGGGGMGPSLRRRFHPAVFWLAQAVTDEEGRLEARFKLPDSLTAYSIVAVAAGQKGGFGVGRSLVRASQPLQLLSALPRFAVTGDRFSARVLVQNLTDRAGKVEVKAQAQGLRLVGPMTQSLEVAPGLSRAVGFSVEALAPGPAWLEVSALMGQEKDAARFTLEVVAATALETQAAAGMLPGGSSREIPLRLPPGARPGAGGLTVTLSPSLAASLHPATRLLLAYPWDCLEQRLSKAVARALRLRLGDRLGLAPEPQDRRVLEDTLAAASDFQMSLGGFTLWPGGRHASPLVTAYLLLAAREFAAAGVEARPASLKLARNYLLNRLRRSKPPKAEDLGGRLQEALAIMVLAQAKEKVDSFLEAALARAQGLTPFGLACLMEAAHDLGKPSAVDRLITILEGSAVVSAAHLHFGAVNPGGLKVVMGSTLRGNAKVLQTLARVRPQYPRLDALAAWVGLRLGQERHLSTQEAVFGLWGLSAYLEASGSGGPWSVEVGLQGRQVTQRAFAAASDPPFTWTMERNLLPVDRDLKLELNGQGEGSGLYAVRLATAPTQPPDSPLNAGLSIMRSYRPLQGSQAHSPALGEEVECSLTVMVRETRHHVVVHDPFPAGLEPLGAAANRPQGDTWGPWSWRELRKTGLMLYASRLRPGVYSFRYRLRAVAPGGFLARPARAEEMYSPEVWGRTAASRLVVR